MFIGSKDISVYHPTQKCGQCMPQCCFIVSFLQDGAAKCQEGVRFRSSDVPVSEAERYHGHCLAQPQGGQRPLGLAESQGVATSWSMLQNFGCQFSPLFWVRVWGIHPFASLSLLHWRDGSPWPLMVLLIYSQKLPFMTCCPITKGGFHLEPKP